MLSRFNPSAIACLLSFATACAPSTDDRDTEGQGEHGFDGLDEPGQYNNEDLKWSLANLKWYELHQDPDSEDCVEYDGCEYAGSLEFLGQGQVTEGWIQNTLVAAVHAKDFESYGGHILRLRQGSNQIDVMVYDRCSDSECEGCCTEAIEETSFLIDLEIHTFEQFGANQGIVEWACLDC